MVFTNLVMIFQYLNALYIYILYKENKEKNPSVKSPLLHLFSPLFLLGCLCVAIPWLSAPEILK